MWDAGQNGTNLMYKLLNPFNRPTYVLRSSRSTWIDVLL